MEQNTSVTQQRSIGDFKDVRGTEASSKQAPHPYACGFLYSLLLCNNSNSLSYFVHLFLNQCHIVLIVSQKCFNISFFKVFFLILDFVFIQINLKVIFSNISKNPVGIFYNCAKHKLIHQKIDIFISFHSHLFYISEHYCFLSKHHTSLNKVMPRCILFVVVTVVAVLLHFQCDPLRCWLLIRKMEGQALLSNYTPFKCGD